jgi:hypothetical protein
LSCRTRRRPRGAFALAKLARAFRLVGRRDMKLFKLLSDAYIAIDDMASSL